MPILSDTKMLLNKPAPDKVEYVSVAVLGGGVLKKLQIPLTHPDDLSDFVAPSHINCKIQRVSGGGVPRHQLLFDHPWRDHHSRIDNLVL